MDSRDKRKHWDEAEKTLLKKLYEKDGLSAKEIAPLLKRTKEAVLIKIVRWGFKHTEEQEFFSRSRSHSGNQNGMWGKESYKKGKTKENDETIAKGAKKLSETLKTKGERGAFPDISGDKNPMWGIPSWNKGLTIETDSRVADYGKKVSRNKKDLWDKKSEEEKEVIRKRCAEIGIQNKLLTSIEVKVQNFLTKLGVEFEYNFHCEYYTCDIHILNTNLIIECQGDYWHANPKFYPREKINKTQIKNVNRDKRKHSYLTKKGYKILYLWENEINKQPGKIIKEIKNFLSQENS